MVYEKRTDVTLLSGNAGVYLMLNDKAAGRRVWSTDDLASDTVSQACDVRRSKVE